MMSQQRVHSTLVGSNTTNFVSNTLSLQLLFNYKREHERINKLCYPLYTGDNCHRLKLTRTKVLVTVLHNGMAKLDIHIHDPTAWF